MGILDLQCITGGSDGIRMTEAENQNQTQFFSQNYIQYEERSFCLFRHSKCTDQERSNRIKMSQSIRGQSHAFIN